MTHDNAHLYLPHVEALRDGELQSFENGRWIDCGGTNFTLSPDHYRRRPKPRERWVNVYPLTTGGCSESIWKTRGQADNYASDGRSECVHYREVLPGEEKP